MKTNELFEAFIRRGETRLAMNKYNSASFDFS